MTRRITRLSLLVFVLALPASSARAQTGADAAPESLDEARALLADIKENERGPYARLRWFCADGTVHPPRPYPCGDRGGGVQHGQLSADARRLHELGFHVGTLYVALDWDAFFDAANDHDRLREIVVQEYLRRTEDGWDLRRARYYRGARQAEDEEGAGRRLLERLLSDPAWVARHYLLTVELVRSMPHGRTSDRLARIRDLSKDLGEARASFTAIRTKIHSYPDSTDVRAVARFMGQHVPPGADVRGRFETLLEELAAYYDAPPGRRLAALVGSPPFDRGQERERLDALIDDLPALSPHRAVARLATEAVRLRQAIERSNDGAANLRRLDALLAMDALAFRRASGLVSPPGEHTRRTNVELGRSLLSVAHARGLLSARELGAQLEVVDDLLSAPTVDTYRYRTAISYLDRSSEWAQDWVSATFDSVLDRYRPVEPAIHGFSDDLLRSTTALPLATLTGQLSRDANHAMGVAHSVFGRSPAGSIVGLNPGMARGILEILPSGASDHAEFHPDRIYVVPRTLAELSPVAGIITLEEGNALSHLQLLARGLGIPNAVIDRSLLAEIHRHTGRDVLYAVSPQGTVILEEIADLSPEHRAFVAERGDDDPGSVRVDPAALDLEAREILPLEALDLDTRRAAVGPKALGVARLRRDFPEHVAPGFVIPFGVFRAHLDRPTGATGPTLYEEMIEFYDRIDALERSGEPVEPFVDERLAYFRTRIEGMDLDRRLVASLRERLAAWGPDRSFGVFVRSDTNVEDLPGFSGAGLNRTIPHVIRFDDILDAVREVWASPFTERAWDWRRPVIENPEQTFVSVLVQKSVPVEKSGVVVTTDLATGRSGYLTVSTSEGVGGGVGGERSETLLVPREGGAPRLLQQAKARRKNVLVTEGRGGVARVPTSGSNRVLLSDEITRLVGLVGEIEERYEPESDPTGRPLPWDIEFGFLDGHPWLFQIRPLVSSSLTHRLASLAALDRSAHENADRTVDLDVPPSRGSDHAAE